MTWWVRFASSPRLLFPLPPSPLPFLPTCKFHFSSSLLPTFLSSQPLRCHSLQSFFSFSFLSSHPVSSSLFFFVLFLLRLFPLSLAKPSFSSSFSKLSSVHCFLVYLSFFLLFFLSFLLLIPFVLPSSLSVPSVYYFPFPLLFLYCL